MFFSKHWGHDDPKMPIFICLFYDNNRLSKTNRIHFLNSIQRVKVFQFVLKPQIFANSNEQKRRPFPNTICSFGVIFDVNALCVDKHEHCVGLAIVWTFRQVKRSSTDYIYGVNNFHIENMPQIHNSITKTNIAAFKFPFRNFHLKLFVHRLFATNFHTWN